MPDFTSDCVARVRAGDLQAFEQLYRAMHAPLLAFATRYVGDLARAEELVQDLFFDVWQSHATWAVTGSVSGYLYGAVRNRALNVRRRDAVEQSWSEAEAMDDARVMLASPPSVDVVLETAELRLRIVKAIDRLPPRCAQIMQLRWHDGLSYADIASVLGISVKGVENQLGRGLKALRADLGTA